LLKRQPELKEEIRQYLESTRVPEGPCRFDVEASLQEFADHPEVFGLRENAARLADRSILLIGGTEDPDGTEEILLPLYKALQVEGANRQTVHIYPTGHSFDNVREQLAVDIATWLAQEGCL
jgi:hypothetical protein